MAIQSSCRLAASTSFPGEGACTEEGRATRATFLQILDHDPRPVEMVLPELAAWRVCGMRLAAVSAEEWVGTGCTICCRRNWRVWVRSTLAAEGKGLVVIFMVRASTERTIHAKGVAEVHVMTPWTAASAVEHSQVEGHLSEEADCKANIDWMVDECLHSGSSLRIPNIKIDSAGVCMPGVINNLGWGS